MCNSQKSNSAPSALGQTVKETPSSVVFDHSHWRDKSLVRGEKAYNAKGLDISKADFYRGILTDLINDRNADELRTVKCCLYTWTSKVIEEEYKHSDEFDGRSIPKWKERMHDIAEFFNFFDYTIVAAHRGIDFHGLTHSFFQHVDSDTIDNIKDFVRNGYLLTCENFVDRWDSVPLEQHTGNFLILVDFLEMLLGNFQTREAKNATSPATKQVDA